MNELRPTKFKDIIGQDNIKQCVQILIKSRHNDVLPHLIFLGPAGTGKTTFACTIANENNTKIYLANGGNISKTKDVLPYLSRLRRGDILFIDEIHRINKRVQESLFTVMEDFRFDVAKGACSINLEKFTLIGATTEAGLLLRPFYDRFEQQFHLEYYNTDELFSIIKNSSTKLKCRINDDAIQIVAKMSKFTPRIANSLLKWCNDFAKANRNSVIDSDVVKNAMSLKDIDENGLDVSDRLYIKVLKLANKPLGLSTICAMTGLSKETVEQQIEPYLFRLGMINKTSKGRILNEY